MSADGPLEDGSTDPALETSTRVEWSGADATDPSLSRGGTAASSEPPTGSRNLGGRCPRCRERLESRLRARYDDELTARLVLVGYCRNCTYHAESTRLGFEMREVRL
ncbi:hypothetical protein [Natronococcus occultus]|uniref:hypothetical protein n=1 Tax=Natronococcus occultus TaxID=29288 RepID=UPI001575B5F9|nr:hypothetical protein [Natronococcus occultus]